MGQLLEEVTLWSISPACVILLSSTHQRNYISHQCSWKTSGADKVWLCGFVHMPAVHSVAQVCLGQQITSHYLSAAIQHELLMVFCYCWVLVCMTQVIKLRPVETCVSLTQCSLSAWKCMRRCRKEARAWATLSEGVLELLRSRSSNRKHYMTGDIIHECNSRFGGYPCMQLEGNPALHVTGKKSCLSP